MNISKMHFEERRGRFRKGYNPSEFIYRGKQGATAKDVAVRKGSTSLRASSPIWVSEVSLARTRERGGHSPK